MASNDNLLVSEGGGGDSDLPNNDLLHLGSTEPTIKSIDGEIVINPIVTDMSGVLNWNNETDTTLGGETIVDNNGDLNWRPTIEGILIQPQFDKMVELRNRANEVRIISDGMTTNVTLDRFEYNRKGEQDIGEATINGESIKGPIYTFQLQSKEQTNDNGSTSISNLFDN